MSIPIKSFPKQFLKTIKRTGLREGLFYDWRKQKDGSQDPSFFLNQPRFQGATILLTRDNFGCGSSREHAPWALLDQGSVASSRRASPTSSTITAFKTACCLWC